MTNVQENLKQQAITLIEEGKQKLGSYASVAAKCKISEATISQVKGGSYKAEGNEMYLKIINALQVFETGWVVVPTTNQNKLFKVISDCRKNRLFMAVSEKAGSGKTCGMEAYVQRDATNSSYFIKCRKWGNRVFLMALLRTLGINPESRYSTNDELLEQVIEFFQARVDANPILFIDQANSLKGSALTNIIIHLYNALEGRISVMCLGTEAFAKDIKKGVKYSKDGFDETDSRLGRRYITLPGSTLNDVIKICLANGIKDEAKAREIFNDCSPIKKSVEKRIVSFVEDHRRLKRIIIREQLKQGGTA